MANTTVKHNGLILADKYR